MHTRISMPAISLLPLLLVASMAWVGLELFDSLRFRQCQDWTALPAPPIQAAQLFSPLPGRLFVTDADATVYCLAGQTWSQCHPPDLPRPHAAQAGLFGDLPQIARQAEVTRMIRSSIGLQAEYSALLADGSLWRCRTDLNSEIERMLATGQVAWLGLPILLAGFGGWWFFELLATQGQPFYWDFWGHGKQIK